MHFCTAKIALGGDERNIMTRDRFSPISWPEVDILRLLHGEQSIMDVSPFVSVNQDGRAERERLALIYGERPIQECWGGKNPPRDLEAPGEVELPKDITWHNPLTGRIVGQVFAFVPPPANLAEVVGDMSKPPAPIGENDTPVVDTDDFGGDTVQVSRSRRR